MATDRMTRPEPARALQDDDRAGSPVGGAERVGEAQQAAHVGAAEAVDRLVGVAHRDEGGLRAHERAQQRHLQRVGVLVLVDVDRPELPRSRAETAGSCARTTARSSSSP